MRVFRPALVLSVAAAVCLAGAASAATKGGPHTLTFTDPAGDNVSPSAASDITSVTWTTVGKGKGKKYTPKSLVVTLTLAAPPTSDGMVMYGVDSQLAGCGELYLQYMPGAKLLDSFDYADCGGDPSDPTTNGGSSFDGVPDVVGNSIVWTLPLKSLPGEVKPGSVFSKLNAYTDFVDPVTSIVGPYELVGQAVYDTAATDAPYAVG
jgi:hypothetical protein